MDKWLLLAGGNAKRAGRLIEIDEGLREAGITTFYADVHAAQANGELAELERRFAEAGNSDVDKWTILGMAPNNAEAFRKIEDSWRDNRRYDFFLIVCDRMAAGERINDLLTEYRGTNGTIIRELEHQHAEHPRQGGFL